MKRLEPDSTCEACSKPAEDLVDDLCDNCGATCDGCAERWPNGVLVFRVAHGETYQYCKTCDDGEDESALPAHDPESMMGIMSNIKRLSDEIKDAGR
ncbi:MAG TPA: hypothetical protein EYN66_12450 [Myxococcales bacterium]|nr:hypothetical protein [Myxococcales bacterium]